MGEDCASPVTRLTKSIALIVDGMPPIITVKVLLLKNPRLHSSEMQKEGKKYHI